MSFYVRRHRNGRTSWTGPIRSERQAGREADAWQSEGFTTEIIPSSESVRRDVRNWDRAKKGRK